MRYRALRAALPAAFSAAVFLGGTAPALAHHPAQEHDPGHVSPGSFVAADLSTTRFDLGPGLAGSYETLALRVQAALLPRLAVGGRIPFHTVRVDGASALFGLGDADLVVKTTLVSSGPVLVTGGLGAELPTGAVECGMGSGHVELAPFASWMAMTGPWHVHGTFGAAISIQDDHDEGHHHGDGGHEHDHGQVQYVSPHASRELIWHAGLARAAGPWWLNAVLGGATSLVEGDAGETFLYVSPQVAFVRGRVWTLLAEGRLGLRETSERYVWQAGLTVQGSLPDI